MTGSMRLFTCLALLLACLAGNCSRHATVTVGTTRTVDALPLALARHKPIFAENQLVVDVVFFERTSDLQAAVRGGTVDAVIIDLEGALLLNDGGERGKIVRVATRQPATRVAGTGEANGRSGQTVVMFSQRMVEGGPAVIRRFLRAYEQAVRELNVRREVYRSLLSELVGMGQEAAGAGEVKVPLFPFPGEVPTESEVEAVNRRLLAGGAMGRAVAYRRVVNAGFLWDPGAFRPAACCGW